MKNRIIKKIMACLLAGAMTVTMPMAAYADEIKDAFDSGGGLDFDSNKQSDTNTNTSAVEIGTTIPDAITKTDLKITGIELDKYSLNFAEAKPDKSARQTLKARVMLTGYDYNYAKEDMDWASTPEELKNQKINIEKNIKWYNDNKDAVKIEWDADNAAEATVYAIGAGQARITAWIEIDNAAYRNPNRPTPGDHQATAVVTVSEKFTDVQFVNITADSSDKFYQKHTYDLRKWTKLELGEDWVSAAGKNENLVYSLTDAGGAKVSLSADGILTSTKAGSSNTIEFDIAAPRIGRSASGKITFADPAEAVKVTPDPDKMELDLGIKDKESLPVSVELAARDNKACTDDVTWTSKNPKIASVEKGEGLSNKIIAKGVGSTTITAKASGGKSANIKVTVYATPASVRIADSKGNESTNSVPFTGKTYTGKTAKLTAVLYGANGKKLPAGTTKFKWGVKNAANSGNSRYASISGKDVATVKPVNWLFGSNEEDWGDRTVVITVKADGKSGNDKYDAGSAMYKLTISQSYFGSIGIARKTLGSSINIVKWNKSSGSGKDTVYVGSRNVYEALCSFAADFDSPKDAVDWSISGTAAKLETDSENNAILTALEAGSVTLTASGVTTGYFGYIGNPKLIKKTVKITVIQNATSIAFAKPETVRHPTGKAQTVTLKVNAAAPKKAALNVRNWKVKTDIYDAEEATVASDNENVSVDDKGRPDFVELARSVYITKAGKNSVTVKVPPNAAAGSVIKVGAYTDGGAIAYAYVYVTEKTVKVTAEDLDNNEGTVNLGGEMSIGTVNVGTDMPAGDGSSCGYLTEPVTYSVDKKSAAYISVDQDGNVKGLQVTPPNKPATVTIRTISGKKTTVKIKVEKAQ